MGDAYQTTVKPLDFTVKNEAPKVYRADQSDAYQTTLKPGDFTAKRVLIEHKGRMDAYQTTIKTLNFTVIKG